jgi:hypothetical protein
MSQHIYISATIGSLASWARITRFVAAFRRCGLRQEGYEAACNHRVGRLMSGFPSCTPFSFAGYDDARPKGSIVMSHSSRADMSIRRRFPGDRLT